MSIESITLFIAGKYIDSLFLFVTSYTSFAPVLKTSFKIPRFSPCSSKTSIPIKSLIKKPSVLFDSPSLKADAWHHRSDSLSSIGALVGILGSLMGYPMMDTLASFVIFIFIVKAAYDVFKDAINKMIDHSCDEDTQKKIYDHVMCHQDVLGIDRFQTRLFGNKIYVDIDIQVDANDTLLHAHSIAQNVHDSIENEFSQVKHIMIHVNPAKDE